MKSYATAPETSPRESEPRLLGRLRFGRKINLNQRLQTAMQVHRLSVLSVPIGSDSPTSEGCVYLAGFREASGVFSLLPRPFCVIVERAVFASRLRYAMGAP